MVETKTSSATAPIFRLSYVSAMADALPEDSLKEIARKAKSVNQRSGVSGILIACAGEFLQVLEGEETAVMALYSRIALDPRHRDVTIVRTARSENRRFADWSMGCFALQPEDLPEGFIYERSGDDRRLRSDALNRIDDLLSTFYRERRGADLQEGFAQLIPA